MRNFSIIALLWLVFAPASFAQSAPSVTVLNAAGVSTLLHPPAYGERVIMLWGLECLYCEPNMERLARMQHEHSDQVELVLVATDSIARRQEIADRLQAAGMGEYRAYAYADPVPARLNYLMDSSWGGEMPRTLVIRADASRIAISGLLTDAQLQRIEP